MLATDDTENKAKDPIMIGFLPYLSLNGPKKSCPTASPMRLVVSPTCTFVGVVLKISAIAGNVGKYISVINGPNADNIPKNTRRNK